jgi:hypothetical protein
MFSIYGVQKTISIVRKLSNFKLFFESDYITYHLSLPIKPNLEVFYQVFLEGHLLCEVAIAVTRIQYYSYKP